MAESAVIFLLNKLAALHHEDFKLLSGFWGDLKYIRDELERMRALLRVADTMEESDEEVNVWVKQVRDVVYDTEDVLDEFELYVSYGHHCQGVYGFLLKIVRPFLKLKARFRIASKMKDIKSRVRNISEGHQRYHCKYNVLEEGSSSSSTIANSRCQDRRGDALLLEEAELVGIDEHKKHLKEYLLGDEPGLKVASVFGMGGMGKTTLVKKVYDDAEVKRHFQTHVWITVSQSFIIEEILKYIIEQLYGEAEERVPRGVNNMNINNLKSTIKEFLNEKRYMLVLDDVWSVEAWESLEKAFPDRECVSRVLLTTRNRDVASTACTGFHGYVYDLKPLSREESWNLFCKKTFRENSCPPQLEELSRGILRRCEGLPLAIVAISGLLSTKDDSIDEWERVHRSLGAELEGNNKLVGMNKILSLSYDDLPYYLKSCFLYLSIFPEDYTIKRMRLIRLWMGEGFIEVRERQTPEEVAEAYLKELVNRGLIQLFTTTRNGRGRTYRIHDLLREIAVSKSRCLNFVTIANANNNTRWPERIRRLTIHQTLENVQKSKRISQLRSLFMFSVPVLQPAFLLASRLVKVLDLQRAPLKTFPNEVLKLHHLRYLSLRGTKVKMIPSSIARLVNLETLDLKGTYVTELPDEIRGLKQLRHLLVYRYEKRSSLPFQSNHGFKPPSGMGDLQSLQKLCFVEANHGSESTSDILSELERMTQLRRLGITKLRREDGMQLCSSIEKMSNLRSLDITSIEEGEIIDIQSLSSPRYLQRLWLQGRLENLPPWIRSMQSLVKLKLRWSQLTDDPLESLQALPYLVELQLRHAYDGDALHFKAGGFQRLKSLDLHDLDALRRVTVEEGAMPHLEELLIICCKSLEEVPAGIEFLTKLKSLNLSDIPNELITKLESKEGGEYAKIRNIPEVKYTFRECGRWKKISL